MKSFFFRLLFSMLLIWTIIRGGIYFLPGDPAEFLAHESLVPVDASKIRETLNLNLSFEQRIFSLPSTTSLINHVDAQSLIKPALSHTFTLTFLAFSFSFLFTVLFLYLSFSIPRLNKPIQIFATTMASFPLFVFAPVVILIFCVLIPVFRITQSPWLPSLCLALHLAAFWFRSIHKKIEHYLPESAILGARARGVPEYKVFFNYLFIPVLGSIVSFLGTEFGSLLGGSVLVELIFQWNGIGSLLLKSVHQRDYPLIEITLLITTFLTVITQQIGYFVQRKLGVNS